MGSRKTIKPKKPKQKAQGDFLKGIDPRIIEMTPEQVEEFIAHAKEKMDPLHADRAVGMASSLQLLIAEVKRGRISLKRLQAILFGSQTEKTANVCPSEADEEKNSDSPEENLSENEEQSSKSSEKNKEKKKQPGHGRRKNSDFPGATREKVSHESLKTGDLCPECPKGRVYQLPEPGVLVRFVGMAPIAATVYELEKLRCNACGMIFTAKAPDEAGPQRYDETVSAAVAVMKYGAGVPFYRLERLQKHVGVSLPTSNQWDLVDDAADLLDPVLRSLIDLAAQGSVLHNDDTTMKILDRPDLVVSKKGKERKGVYTTGIVARVVADDQNCAIALFMTGMHHAGENLAEVLKKRNEALSLPIQMCDASSMNTKGDFETILAHCIAHARRRFVEVVDDFPEECSHLLEEIGKVYKIDAKSKGMSSSERLFHHQKHSDPIMTALHKWLTDQIEEKKTEPNSGLGEAIKYMLKYWEELTLFLREAGVPLDNNICERALKRAVLHRKNSMFYKTINGAYVGDLFMSLIHTAELNKANPFDYLVKLQKNHALAKENPEEWMPWNYQKTLADLPA